MKKLTNKEEFPKETHYAIVQFGQRLEDGGYKEDPGWMVPTTDYYFTLDKLEWEIEIGRLTTSTEYGKPSFSAFVANPVTISTKISVTIKS